MNPLMIFSTVRHLSDLIDHANKLAGPEKRWSLAYTNRSFILAAVAVLAQIALAVGLPIPVAVDVAAETIYSFVTVGALAWAAVERVTGKTRAVFNRRQAVDAIREGDALAEALHSAGAR